MEFDEFLARMRSHAGREPGVECLLYRPDGTTKWVLIEASTVRTDDGLMFVLRVVDFDGRKSIAEDLREAQRLGKIGQLAGRPAQRAELVVGGDVPRART